jgi:hypothetical protein
MNNRVAWSLCSCQFRTLYDSIVRWKLENSLALDSSSFFYFLNLEKKKKHLDGWQKICLRWPCKFRRAMNFLCVVWAGQEQSRSEVNGQGATVPVEIVSSGEIGSGTPRVSDEIRQGGNLRIFSYLDLKSATRNFRPDSLLGEGGFGSVYKGWVDETGTAAARAGTGITVAVKQLNHEGLQGHKEWLVSLPSLFLLFFLSCCTDCIWKKNSSQIQVILSRWPFHLVSGSATFVSF